MLRHLATTTLAASLVAFAAPAFSETLVKEVEIEADLEAIKNASAAEHWTSIADDLENAMVERLVGMTSEDGAKISVDIDEVELANSLQSAMGTAESKLMGRVNISHESDNTKFDTYDLTVTFEQAGPFFLPGTDLTAITTDSKEYYDAMIAAFADAVVTRLK